MRHKILIVDDEEDYRIILGLHLRNEGYDVDCACSAEEALSMDLGEYSLFIVDVGMRPMNGFEFVKKLNSMLHTKMAPVIFCTCFAQEDFRLRGFDVGADDYITKPFKLPIVAKRVQSVLKRSYPELEE